MVLGQMQCDFTYTIKELGVKVAGLMTTEMVARRLDNTQGADKVILPGRCQGDVAALAQKLGLPVERGPDELKDLPLFFGKAMHKIDLTDYRVKIFAEIVDAPMLTVEETVAKAHYYRQQGADVIDIGCLPATEFAHLTETVTTLKQEGFAVSVDSMETADLQAGGKAGADYLLSITSETLFLASDFASIPIVIPDQHGDLSSLAISIAALQKLAKPFIVDPILDPIHFGFAQSLARIYQFRQQYPDIAMMLGVGNLTELTHADTVGMNTLLLGICSELSLDNILTTQVSAHTCRAIKEIDIARRIMAVAGKGNMLPKHIDNNLLSLHETAPHPYSQDEILALADTIRDPSFRIQVSREGVHIYNRDGLHTATEPFALFDKLAACDSSHAFYLGVQLARAQIAWQLGKRFTQDAPLDWGCASNTKPNTK